MMLIWRISLQETHCWKVIYRTEMALTNYTLQMLCFLYSYHCWSKLNSHRGLWGIFATSPQRKDSMMALWESVHSSLCIFFREIAVLYFFPNYRYAQTFLVLLSDTVIHLQFVRQRPFFGFAPNILTWWQHPTLHTSESIELHHNGFDKC